MKLGRTPLLHFGWRITVRLGTSGLYQVQIYQPPVSLGLPSLFQTFVSFCLSLDSSLTGFRSLLPLHHQPGLQALLASLNCLCCWHDLNLDTLRSSQSQSRLLLRGKPAPNFPPGGPQRPAPGLSCLPTSPKLTWLASLSRVLWDAALDTLRQVKEEYRELLFLQNAA